MPAEPILGAADMQGVLSDHADTQNEEGLALCQEPVGFRSGRPVQGFLCGWWTWFSA